MKAWVILTGIVVLLGSVLALQLGISSRSTLSEEVIAQNSVVVQTLQNQPKSKVLTTSLGFWGNMFWGRYIDDWSKANTQKTQYPFQLLPQFAKTSHDYWISGLECSMTDQYLSSLEQDTSLTLNCPPEYLPQAHKYIDAFTLANNHSGNLDDKGFQITKQNLEKEQVDYFGHYDNKIDEICKVIQIPFFDSLDQKVKKPVALCGYHWVFRLPTQAELAEITKYSKDYITIVMPHGGAEYTPEPDEIKTDLYRRMIDAGADMVIGDHPHVTQTTEIYNDKLIVYSMGNFLFDQQTAWEKTHSIGIRANLELSDSSLLGKPQYKVTYSMRCTDNSGKQLHKASTEDCNRLKQNARWPFAVEY
jgi:Bacterial capsule synthesis protein PGA_cap